MDYECKYIDNDIMSELIKGNQILIQHNEKQLDENETGWWKSEIWILIENQIIIYYPESSYEDEFFSSFKLSIFDVMIYDERPQNIKILRGNEKRKIPDEMIEEIKTYSMLREKYG